MISFLCFYSFFERLYLQDCHELTVCYVISYFCTVLKGCLEKIRRSFIYLLIDFKLIFLICFYFVMLLNLVKFRRIDVHVGVCVCVLE